MYIVYVCTISSIVQYCLAFVCDIKLYLIVFYNFSFTFVLEVTETNSTSVSSKTGTGSYVKTEGSRIF